MTILFLRTALKSLHSQRTVFHTQLRQILTETEPGVVSIESVDKTVVNKAGDYTIAGTVRNNGYNYVVKEIKASAFNGCDNIESITVPNTVEKLGVNAIAGNLNLKSITFETGSKLTTIENGALSDNGKLEAITIPASVKNIGDYILGWNYSLATVEFEEGTNLNNIGKGMFFRDEGSPLQLLFLQQ